MKLVFSLCACLAASGAPAFAQGVAVPTAPFDNIHILTPDPAQTREWYIAHLGATAAPTAGMAYVGKTLLVFLKNDTAQPSAGGSIDHVAFSFADVDEKTQELEAAGAKRLAAASDLPGAFGAGFVQDPWGVKIEILTDAAMKGLHHVHLRVRDPDVTIRWFQQMMGGVRASLNGKGTIEGLRYGSAWLLVAGSGGETPAPSANRAIQHIAWRVPNIDDARAVLIARGLNVGDARPYQDVRFAILENPSGVRVEIIQRPQP